MTAAPYIGITGFATADDVAVARECAALVPRGYRLMAGVLVSAKTMRSERSPSARYPNIHLARDLVWALTGIAWTVVHYNTRATGNALADELAQVCDCFQSIGGIQLNVVRPDPDALRRFVSLGHGVELILQINRASLGSRATPAAVYDFVRPYGAVDHALLDLSGGRGEALDVGLAKTIAAGWISNARLGVAGGLDATSVEALRGLAVSCDAESRLRTASDTLDPAACVAYVRAAAEALGGV